MSKVISVNKVGDWGWTFYCWNDKDYNYLFDFKQCMIQSHVRTESESLESIGKKHVEEYVYLQTNNPWGYLKEDKKPNTIFNRSHVGNYRDITEIFCSKQEAQAYFLEMYEKNNIVFGKKDCEYFISNKDL